MMYTTPTEEGSCAAEGTNGAAHEYCRCDTSKLMQHRDDAAVCKAHCDSDNNCKGYDYILSGYFCRFFTISSCRGGCWKDLNYVGKIGDLYNEPSSGLSGCFIKNGIL